MPVYPPLLKSKPVDVLEKIMSPKKRGLCAILSFALVAHPILVAEAANPLSLRSMPQAELDAGTKNLLKIAGVIGGVGAGIAPRVRLPRCHASRQIRRPMSWAHARSCAHRLATWMARSAYSNGRQRSPQRRRATWRTPAPCCLPLLGGRLPPAGGRPTREQEVALLVV